MTTTTPAGTYVVGSTSSNEFSLRNMLFVGNCDPLSGSKVTIWRCGPRGEKQSRCSGVYLVGTDPSLQPGAGYSSDSRVVAVSGPMRKGAGLNQHDLVRLEVLNNLPKASLVVVQVTKLKPGGTGDLQLSCEEQLQPSADQLLGFPVAIHSSFIRPILDMYVTFTVSAITCDGDPRAAMAEITNKTTFTFEAGQPYVHISGQGAMINLFKHGGMDIQELGIGGLDDQFAEIFRGAFASRAAPAHVMRKMNFQHTKGILLYGPPGTGKTLIARQIGKLLNAVEPKIVNGPEILDKFVGESEKKVRELFADAEAEQKLKGDDSALHVIIFDEIDAICKARGSSGGGTGVHDSIVNTLLTKIDGVESLNNILLIGMTNRPDLLDEALVRPGRIELKIEIGLPDAKGRLQILTIHTAAMKKHDYLSRDVNLEQIADSTKNFTGAELQATIRKATNWALEDILDKNNLQDVPKDFHPTVSMHHFTQVLANEMRPAFGAAHDTISSYFARGMFNFGARYNRIMEDVPTICALTDVNPKRTILLTGEHGTGKTAMAAYLSTQMDAPFVKIIDHSDVMGKPESAIVDVVSKAFTDAYKSPKSVLILDDFRKLVYFTEHGVRYNLAALQAIQVLLDKAPPAGKQIVVIVTADSSVTSILKLSKSFHKTVHVPMLTRGEAIAALVDSRLCAGNLLAGAVDLLPPLGEFRCGIKDLSIILQSCKQNDQLDLQQWASWMPSLAGALEDDDF